MNKANNNELENFKKQYIAYQQKLYENRIMYDNALMEQIIKQTSIYSLYKGQNKHINGFDDLLPFLYSHNLYYTYVDSKDIENLSLNDLSDETKLGYFYCLYTCNPLLVLDNENNTTLNNKVVTQNFGYKDDFYLSFIANKESLSNEYLEARKALYKTMMKLREEREQEYKEEQERISQLSHEEYLQEQREKERQERFSNRNTTNTDNLILESKDKNNVIIFLDSANSLSNLIHIHNERIDIFTKDTSTIDIQELESLITNYKQRYTESNNQESHIDFHQESKLTLDSLNSSIVGCTNNIAGVPTPCTLISVILPSARAFKKFNDDYPIMQDLVSSGVMSDKGFPLICTPKENTFRINSPSPSNTKDTSKEALASVIRLTKPSMRLRYKINTLQRDNLPIYRLKLNGEIIESSSDDEALKSITLDIHKDTKDLDSTIKLDKRAYSSQSTHNTTTHNNTNTTDNNATDSTTSLLSLLLKDYPKYYEFKEIDLQLDTNLLSLILIIPKKIPKVYDKAYKEYEYKDYGVGRFQYVYRYCECRELEVKNNDYTNIGLHGDALTQYIITLLTPAKAKKIEIHLANGVDSMTESKDDVDSHILKCSVINGGHSERLWGDI